MMSFTTRSIVLGIAALGTSACSVEPARQVDDQPLMQMQNSGLQGVVLQGALLHGMTMQGFRFAGATLNGAALSNFRLENGELVGEQSSVTLRGTALANAHLFAEAQNNTAHPPQNAVVEYRITAIAAEDPIYDPTHTGNTFLYTLEQNIDNTGTWQPACAPDHDGRRVAIPLADVWDDKGNRNSSAPLFTLACTTSAIADCYRWGYRPWVTGFGNLKSEHWGCTRLARADYCGDGTNHTLDGTMINIWDNLPPPGPIQAHGTTPPGMSFEAAWDQTGALCLSHARWAFNGSVVAAACPNKLHPPGSGSPSVCDDAAQGMMVSGSPLRLFNESAINH
jgi:ADYC domain-containing protein